MIGLILIGTGTGGIKPCVSAFGGDQFSPEQVSFMQWIMYLFVICFNQYWFFLDYKDAVAQRMTTFFSQCLDHFDI